MTKANNIHSPSRSATSGATINQPRCGHAPGSGGLTYATRYRMLLELRARQRGRTNDFDELIDLANRAALEGPITTFKAVGAATCKAFGEALYRNAFQIRSNSNAGRRIG